MSKPKKKNQPVKNLDMDAFMSELAKRQHGISGYKLNNLLGDLDPNEALVVLKYLRDDRVAPSRLTRMLARGGITTSPSAVVGWRANADVHDKWDSKGILQD